MKKFAVLLLLAVVAIGLSVTPGCGNDANGTQAESQQPGAAGTEAVQASGTGASQSGNQQSSADTAAGGCSVVDGSEVATAVGGTLVSSQEYADTPPSQAKCTFNINVNGSERVFVMWQMPAEDFEALKDAEEDPVTEVSGVGDKAYTTFHPETQRYEMAAAVTGKFTVQVTGDNQDEIRSFVEQVVSRY